MHNAYSRWWVNFPVVELPSDGSLVAATRGVSTLVWTIGSRDRHMVLPVVGLLLFADGSLLKLGLVSMGDFFFANTHSQYIIIIYCYHPSIIVINLIVTLTSHFKSTYYSEQVNFLSISQIKYLCFSSIQVLTNRWNPWTLLRFY